ncbi:ABC transporter ATP-binding protein [Aciditerrimonas ferrireducens]|jgi:NitT/TauT family transport system ATP-binding protein|uniref:ABC transporter ATP-binding protein n=1 Tax=Aciditerrimonas ferrireducens TaxID=667306 RepID=A0ABV6BZX2_9ACTN
MTVEVTAGVPAVDGVTLAIEVRGLSHAFERPDGSSLEVLRHVDVSVPRGRFVAIVGPSGCGKTTLLNLVAGIEEVQSGSVAVSGEVPRCGNQRVGYLFARDALLPWRTVLGNTELAMELAGVGKVERRARAMALLEEVGLAEMANAYPAQLSQGMRQRVAIARTLAPHPELVLLDEPFSALDAQTKLLLQDAFCRLWGRLGATVVLITHDLGEAVALGDQVVLMTSRPGRIKRVFDVALPRPRSIVDLPSEPEYHRIVQELWAELREEVARR